MIEINFVTCNENKVREVKQIMGEDFDVKQEAIDYPELRSDDPEEIVALAAKQLADTLRKTVVVEDSGFFIKALGDFPGVVSAYAFKRIGLDGLLKLMEGVSDRACCYKSAVGFCEPGREPVTFLGIEEGTMADSVRDEGFGWCHDKIFIPEGSDKTYGETLDVEEKKMFRRKAFEKLKKHLLD